MGPHSARNFAELRVYSDALTPAEIAACVGVEPEKVWKRGRPPRPNGPYAWILGSARSSAEPMGAHVENLLARVGPIVGEVRVLSEANEVIVYCAAYPHSEDDINPGVYLDRHALDAICVLGAAFSYEACYLGGDE